MQHIHVIAFNPYEVDRHFIQGGWADEFAATVNNTLYRFDTLVEMDVLGGSPECRQRALCTVECIFGLIRERWNQLSFYITCYPAKFRLIDGKTLSPGDTQRVRENVVRHDYRIIMDNERQALGCNVSRDLVKACFSSGGP